MTLDLANLRSLLERATPRPWVHRQIFHDNELRADVVQACDGSEAKWIPAVSDGDYATIDYDEPDAALIVAAVNALPELLYEVERLRSQLAMSTPTEVASRGDVIRENEKLRAALREACDIAMSNEYYVDGHGLVGLAVDARTRIAELRALAGDAK